MSYRPEMSRIAAAYSLDADLVAALVEKESSGNPWAWNPEPRYRWFWNVRTGTAFRKVHDTEVNLEIAPPDFPSIAGDRDQEWWAQQASWGLLQVMGAVARERGFDGPYLTALCDPVINLEIGCRHLAHLTGYMNRRYKGLSSSQDGAVRFSVLAAYNGGIAGNTPDGGTVRNRAYAQDVLDRYARIRKTLRA